MGAEGIQPLLRPPGYENERLFHVVLVPEKVISGY